MDYSHSSSFMCVALLPVNLVFVLLISCESLMKNREYLISTPSVLLKQLVYFYRTKSGAQACFKWRWRQSHCHPCSLLLFLKRTTSAFNKHVIRRKTAGICITDGAVLGISKEGTTHTDGSLFQHLVMHIAHNFIPMLNNQYKQYRCYYLSRGSPCKASSRDLVFRAYLLMRITHKGLRISLSIFQCREECHVNLHPGVVHG